MFKVLIYLWGAIQQWTEQGITHEVVSELSRAAYRPGVAILGETMVAIPITNGQAGVGGGMSSSGAQWPGTNRFWGALFYFQESQVKPGYRQHTPPTNAAGWAAVNSRSVIVGRHR